MLVEQEADPISKNEDFHHVKIDFKAESELILLNCDSRFIPRVLERLCSLSLRV